MFTEEMAVVLATEHSQKRKSEVHEKHLTEEEREKFPEWVIYEYDRKVTYRLTTRRPGCRCRPGDAAPCEVCTQMIAMEVANRVTIAD